MEPPLIDEPEEGFSITGTVYNYADGPGVLGDDERPLADVAVWVNGTTVVTDEDGAYALTGLRDLDQRNAVITARGEEPFFGTQTFPLTLTGPETTRDLGMIVQPFLQGLFECGVDLGLVGGFAAGFNPPRHHAIDYIIFDTFGHYLDATIILAPAGGIVYDLGTGGADNLILSISYDQTEQIITNFLHLRESLVAKGDAVQAGQPIAIAGDTGNTLPHLHFELVIRKSETSSRFDPNEFFTREGNPPCFP